MHVAQQHPFKAGTLEADTCLKSKSVTRSIRQSVNDLKRPELAQLRCAMMIWVVVTCVSSSYMLLAHA